MAQRGENKTREIHTLGGNQGDDKKLKTKKMAFFNATISASELISNEGMVTPVQPLHAASTFCSEVETNLQVSRNQNDKRNDTAHR